MCDMIPAAEHWRLAVWEAQALQHGIMGYLPGFATPRIVCDVPYVGKRWVHQVHEYDRERGITYWTKNYRTGIETGDAEALSRTYEYYDPIFTLPTSGQEWWDANGAASVAEADASREVHSYSGSYRGLRPGTSVATNRLQDGRTVFIRRAQHNTGPGRDVGGCPDLGEQEFE